MRKIPTLFLTEPIRVKTPYGPRIRQRAIDEVRPGCEWVLEGTGICTRKFDGTSCYILRTPLNGLKLYKRLTLELRRPFNPRTADIRWTQDGHGYEFKSYPPGVILAQDAPVFDEQSVYGHWPAWIPVDFRDPVNKWHWEAWQAASGLKPGTYELCGPRINANPEALPNHQLLPHGQEILEDCPRDYDGLMDYFALHDIEGVVFWETPGDLSSRLCKIRQKDFGLRRASQSKSKIRTPALSN